MDNTVQSNYLGAFEIRGANHEIPVIPEDTMVEMLKNIAYVNKQIKAGTHIRSIQKSAVYTIKRHIIDYVLYMINSGRYKTITAWCNGVYQDAIYETGHQKLTTVKITLPDGQELMFHYDIEKYQTGTRIVIMNRRALLQDNIKYERTPFDEETADPEQSMARWKSIIDTCMEYGFAPLQMTNSKHIFHQRLVNYFPALVYNGGNIVTRDPKGHCECVANGSKKASFTSSVRGILSDGYDIDYHFLQKAI